MNTRNRTIIAFLTPFITSLLCVFTVFSQEIHVGVNQSQNLSDVKQMEFSPEGNYLLTLDDQKIAIYHIRKRQYVNFIDVPENSYLIPRDEHSFLIVYYGSIQDSVYLYIKRYNYHDNVPQKTDSISLSPFDEIAGEIYYDRSFQIDSPEIWHYNTKTGKLFFIVQIGEKGKTARRQYLATIDLDSHDLTIKNLGVGRVNSISSDDQHIFVATPHDILQYTPQVDQLANILHIEDEKDAYATVKTMNGRLHILSTYQYTLYDYVHSQTLETKNTIQYSRGWEGNYFLARNEDFIVTQDDQAYLVDQKIQRIEEDTYNIVRITNGPQKPFKGQRGHINKISYNAHLNILAFDENIVDISHGRVFSRVDSLLQTIEVVEFTDKPGNILIGKYNELFEVDLATQEIKYVPTVGFSTLLSVAFNQGNSKDYFFMDTTLQYYNSNLGNYKYPLVKIRNKLHRVYNLHDTPTHLVSENWLYFFLPNSKSIPLKNETRELEEYEYTLYVSKNNTIKKIDLRVDLSNYYENDPSSFMNIDHSRFIEDKKLLVIFFNATDYGNPIQHWIDLEKAQIIKTTRYKLLIFKNDNSLYLTEDGFYSIDAERVDIPFESSLMSGLIHETNKSYIHIRDEIYAFGSIYQDSVYIVDFSNKTRKSVSFKEGIKKIIKDPHSPNLFILDKNSQLHIWNTESRESPIHLRILCKFDGNTITGEPTIKHPETLILSSDNLYSATGNYKSSLFWNSRFNPDYNYVDSRYNRPDIILGRLNYGQPEFLAHLRQVIDKRIERNTHRSQITNDIKFDPAKNTYLVVSPGQKFTLHASFDEPLKNVKGYTIYLNGVKTKSVENLKSNLVADSIDLFNKVNKIKIVLMDKNGRETTGDYQYINGQQKPKTALYTIAIGVSNYRDRMYNLTYARKDAEDISSISKGLYTYSNRYNLQLYDDEATLENIVSKTQEFLRSVKPTDQVIVYFAGHGLLDKDKNLYLAPHDMIFDKPKEKGLLINHYLSVLEEIPSLYKLLIMDACHTGLDEDYVAPAYYDKKDTKGLTIVTRGSIVKSSKKQKPQLLNFAFETLNQGNGIDIIAASGASEFAVESATANNGVFTYNFINGLLDIENDLNKDDKLDIEEIIKNVSLNTLEMTGGRQRPMLRQANQESNSYLIETKDTREGKAFEAAKGFDRIEYLEDAIKNGFDINKLGSGLSLLMYAARQNNLHAIRILLQNNADIEKTGTFRKGPAIFFAAYNGHLNATEILLAAYRHKQTRIKLTQDSMDRIQQKSKECYEMIKADVEIID